MLAQGVLGASSWSMIQNGVGEELSLNISPQPADSPSSRERPSQRRARAWPFKMWELRQESHLLKFKSYTDCSGLQPPFLHSINVSSILYPVIHLKHECDLSLSFLKLISVSSSCTKSKLLHIVYKARHGLPASPCLCLALILCKLLQLSRYLRLLHAPHHSL